MDFSLTDEEKAILLKTARDRIKTDLGLGKPDYPEPTDKLEQICSAFVTLHNSRMLRGCIGNIIGRKPLIKTVLNMAHAAAFDDPRFPALSADEFDRIDIEISVLSPLRKITDINKIEIGKHGILMTQGYNSGVLLPQVATEQGWDLNTFVEHTCMKAGLRPDAWKDPSTEIEIFSAVIFSENN
ncbi:MAG TPA: AMMECR1 domain-containing protein [Spirochaeta sp.]|nr:AMMECR1 domain-containing protein [Spirochaeta sp.]